MQHGKTKYVKKIPDEISKFSVEFLTSSPHKTYMIICKPSYAEVKNALKE